MVEFTLRTVASPLHDPAALAELLDGYLPLLRSAGRGDAGPEVVFVLTGGTEAQILDLVAEQHVRAPGEPVLLVAHPFHNSLPAALEALARVHQDGGRGSITMLTGPADDAGSADLARRVGDVTCARSLRAARIGLVGDPSDWLVASMPVPEVVARRWGPTVVPVDLGEVIDEARAVPATLVRRLTEDVADGARSLTEPCEADVQAAAKLHPVLRERATSNGLDAITVRCFDALGALHTSGCVALSELNDEGIVAGCEGDLPSTIAMLWARRLLGLGSWMANPATVDRGSNEILLAHCTIARELVTAYRLRSHFESGIGVGVAGELAATEVTLVRIGGTDLERLWVAEGTASVPPQREHLCRTQVLVRVDDVDVGELLDAPLGNHLVLVPGRHADRLRRYWETLVAPG
ncbi:MAG TPA: hypothetical protein VM262_14000 [Acidimicrobiales bacterium]|nr:hypothetical protein [Acidimicrobiales bacterium]